MPAEDPRTFMALEWRTVQRILILVMILSFGIAILGAVGEYRGWWNDVGEVLMTFGTVTGALSGIVGLVTSAGQGTVEDIQGTVEGNHEVLESNNDILQDNNELLEDSTRKLETLDDIQLELDRQTGVLERQVEVLHQIRDSG